MSESLNKRMPHSSNQPESYKYNNYNSSPSTTALQNQKWTWTQTALIQKPASVAPSSIIQNIPLFSRDNSNSNSSAATSRTRRLRDYHHPPNSNSNHLRRDPAKAQQMSIGAKVKFSVIPVKLTLQMGNFFLLKTL